MKDLAVYIHIPFCDKKCYYCDFTSFSGLDKRIEEYIEHLLLEMDLYRESLKEYNIKTIFLGGGTPSYIDGSYIVKIIRTLFEKYNCSLVEEITIEANPGTLDREKLMQYREAGVNRISLGVQTLNDQLLKSIGRLHTAAEAIENIKLIRELGFSNINVDLMFGLPDQTVADCISTLEEIVDLGVEHISYYSLILEEKTMMNRWFEEGKIRLPDEDVERDMYHEGVNFLKSRGYEHYEISNFCKPGYQCKHNLFYWTLKPYIGFGISSHSNIEGKRFCNYNTFKDYFDSIDRSKVPVLEVEDIDSHMEMAEYVIMGLRLIGGINKEDFKGRFGRALEDVYGKVIDSSMRAGLLVDDGTYVRFTDKGLDLSNMVYVDILP